MVLLLVYINSTGTLSMKYSISTGTGTTSMIHTPGGMLSVPIGLGPFIPNMKPQQPGSNIRGHNHMPLLQVIF